MLRSYALGTTKKTGPNVESLKSAMTNRLTKVKMGLLGGGQLARMMALKCHEMGIKPYVLSAHATDPAAQITPYFIKGNLFSQRDLHRFLKQVDLAVFENEFLDPSLLHSVSLSTNTPIHPTPKVMHLLQDRLTQKKSLIKYKIPTAPFVSAHAKTQISALFKLFPKGFVLKKRHAGYDGQGTLIINTPKAKTLQQDRNPEKLKLFIKKNSPLIIEPFIPFKKELALILIRNRKTQIVELPLVETFQEQACCRWVKGPIRHAKKEALIKKLKGMIQDIQYEGAIAFELFETQKGTLWVNEIAPRVHNSGHYSLDALSEDQFSLHIKAVLNMDLKPPYLRAGGFAMLNLLGEKTRPHSRWLIPAGTHLHWYGKKESRPGRKMGHINNMDRTPQQALSTLLNFMNKEHKITTLEAKNKT